MAAAVEMPWNYNKIYTQSLSTTTLTRSQYSTRVENWGET